MRLPKSSDNKRGTHDAGKFLLLRKNELGDMVPIAHENSLLRKHGSRRRRRQDRGGATAIGAEPEELYRAGVAIEANPVLPFVDSALREAQNEVQSSFNHSGVKGKA